MKPKETKSSQRQGGPEPPIYSPDWGYGVPALFLTKIQNFFRTFQDPTKNFPGLLQSLRMFNIKKKHHLLKYSVCKSTAEHTALSKMWTLTFHNVFKHQSTKTGCYTTAACFPFKPLEKYKTFKDIFPGLSRTKVIVSPVPSWNFQEKIQNFPGGVGTLWFSPSSVAGAHSTKHHTTSWPVTDESTQPCDSKFSYCSQPMFFLLSTVQFTWAWDQLAECWLHTQQAFKSKIINTL